MEITTTLKIYLTAVRMPKFRKTTGNQCCKGCEENKTFIRCQWNCKLVWLLWKPLKGLLKKLKPNPSCDPARALLGVCQRTPHQTLQTLA